MRAHACVCFLSPATDDASYLSSPSHQRTDQLLSLPTSQLPPTASLQNLAQSLLLLLQIFYDLNAQDLPEFFEDNLAVFFGNPEVGDPGLLGKYLRWDREELRGDVSAVVVPLPLATSFAH